ncbi:MAG: hypothetical protein PHQ75_02045 [Thermoguttaceae bacterium]|nr:hypothetical protein [Thermoguttaceae bacterium]
MSIVFRNRVFDTLLHNYPDYALTLFGFKDVVPLKSDKILGYTDRQNIYLYEGMTDDELAFVVIHEILHILLLHRTDPSLANHLGNIAQDLELSHYYDVNLCGIAKASRRLRNTLSVYADHSRFYGLDVNEIYAALKAEQKDCPNLSEEIHVFKSSGKQDETQQEGSPSDGADQSGQQDANDDTDESHNGKNGQQGNSEDEPEGQSSGDSEDESDGQSSGNSADESEGQSSGDSKNETDGDKEAAEPGCTPEEQQKLRQKMLEAVNANYGMLDEEQQQDVNRSMVGKMANTEAAHPPVVIPEHVKLLKRMRQYFMREVAVTRKMTFVKPNEKYRGSGIVRRSNRPVYRQTATLAVYCDTSGSMNKNKLKRALGCVQEIEKIPRCSIKVFYFSDNIHDDYESSEHRGTQYSKIFIHAASNGYQDIAIVTDDSQDMLINTDKKRPWRFRSVWIIGIEPASRDNGVYSISERCGDRDTKRPVEARRVDIAILS